MNIYVFSPFVLVFPIFPLLSVCLAFSWSLLLQFSVFCLDIFGHVQTLTLGEEGPFLSAASRASGEALGDKVKTELLILVGSA